MSSKHINTSRPTWRLARVRVAPRSLEQMIAEGRYDKVSQWIPQVPFPIQPERFSVIGTKLHHFGKFATPQEVVARLAEDGRELCYLETLLARGRDLPHDQRRFPIIGRPYDGLVPYLTGDASGRQLLLGLHSPEGGYREICRFLSVPIVG